MLIVNMFMNKNATFFSLKNTVNPYGIRDLKKIKISQKIWINKKQTVGNLRQNIAD